MKDIKMLPNESGIKILIIGHSVVDHIETKESTQVKPGGAFYSTVGLYYYKEKEDEISIITSIDDDSFHHFKSIYSNINLDHSQKSKAVPTVYLKIFEDREREECYGNLTEKLLINPGVNFKNYEGILINMITGFDIDLTDLHNIRSKFSGPIYMDVHSLARGIDNNSKRYHRKIPNAEQWLRNIDIVQANEYELLTLSDEKQESRIAEDVLNFGVKCLIVTKGEKGASVYFKKNGQIKHSSVININVNSVNTVGCGDIFGAVFFYSYIKSENFETSLKAANIAAGVSTIYNSIEEFKNLRNDAIQRTN